MGTGTFSPSGTLQGNVVAGEKEPVPGSGASMCDLAGDYNGDCSVDAADYVLWQATSGSQGPGLAADGNGDQLVDEMDYQIWRENYGTSVDTKRTVMFVTADLFFVTTVNSYPPLFSDFGSIEAADFFCNESAFIAGLMDWDGSSIIFKAVMSTDFIVVPLVVLASRTENPL